MALQDRDKITPAPSVRSKVAPARSGVKDHAAYEGTPLSMTGIRGGLLYSNFMKIVLMVLIAIFAIGFGLQSIGTGFGGGNNGGPAGSAASAPDPVARVAGQDIKRDVLQNGFSRQMSMMEQFGQHTGVADVLRSKQQTLQALTDQAAQYKAAQDAGIPVSDAEVEQKIKDEINQQIKSEQGANEAGFRRQIEGSYGSIAAYQEKMAKDVDREAVRRQLMIEKIEKQVKDTNKVSEDDYKASMTKLKLLQIIVRPKLPAPTEKDQKAAQTKNGADAKVRADKIMAELKANATPANFMALAKKESDDVMTKAKGGDLGWKLPTELYYSPAIKDAITTGKTNLIGPIQDDMTKDFYIFDIQGRKLELPKDYSKPKKKDEYIKSFKTQKDNEVWSKYQEGLKKKNAVEIDDPALAAYKIQTEQLMSAPPDQQNALRQQALDKYQAALAYSGPLEKAAIQYQMAQLYHQINQPDKALAALQDANKENSNDTTLGLELANALQGQKKNQEALAQLQRVDKQLDQTSAAPASPFMMGGANPNDSLRMQIASQYEALGKKDLATAERKKIKPPPAPPRGMGGPGGLGGSTNLNTIAGGGPRTITIPAGGGATGKP